jgi:ParB family chromosome partitioning protein
MTAKKTRLGRGLDALLSTSVETPAAEDKEELKHLPVDLLQRGRYQPRTHMDPDALADLSKSIEAQGVVQPIVVRPLGTGNFEIIAGERRWRAAQMAGLESVPCVVRRIPDEAAIAVALIENIQRENLNPIEEATALQRLLDEFEMTHQQVADAVGRSRAAVSNLLRLLSLNEDARRMLEQGLMDMGHARALLSLSGAAQSEAAHRVVEQSLSVRETEKLVRKMLEGPAGSAGAKPAAPALDPDIRRLQDELSERIGAKVSISHSKGGKGRLAIDYHSVDELQGILDRIR